ncbi:AMP-binding protein [Streptomyces sp. NPDC091046]|uniref:AMP-binding protein n=1 Tax=Streptomyces sp. NPDC091046 TaxID=3365973 RepID=UPI003802A903
MSAPIRPGLHERFRRGLELSPGRTAVHTDTTALTYQDAHELALTWAGTLLSAAPEPPRAVGVLAAKGTEAYAGMLAALYAGAAVVPLHPGFPAVRTERMLRDAGVSAVVADDQGLAALRALPRDPGVPVLAPGRDAGPLRQLRPSRNLALAEPRPVAGEDVATILFTSGSTGRPKGVPVTHGSTAHYFDVLDRRYDFTPDDVFSQTFDLNFDCALFDLFCAWGAGATVRPVPAHAYRELPGFAKETGMSVWFSTPSAIALLRRMRALAPGALHGLRWSFFAGEALRADDVEDWLRAAPASRVENLYGPTELTVTVTGHRWDPRRSPGRCVNGLVPIGAVHDGHAHLLLGPDDRPVADEGELCVSGPQMTPGYLYPADDAGRFLHHRGRTWYRTGDRVRRLDDGELIYLGRLDSQVQIQGWRVEVAEIEHALRSSGAVEDAVVVAAAGPRGTELYAFYTGDARPAAELAGKLGEVLPHALVPKHFRQVSQFPLNSNRKIDRRALAASAAHGIGVG